MRLYANKMAKYLSNWNYAGALTHTHTYWHIIQLHANKWGRQCVCGGGGKGSYSTRIERRRDVVAVTQKTEHVLSNKMRSYQLEKLLPNHLHFFFSHILFKYFKRLKIASIFTMSLLSLLLSFSTFVILYGFYSSTHQTYRLKLTQKPHCSRLIRFW